MLFQMVPPSLHNRIDTFHLIDSPFSFTPSSLSFSCCCLIHGSLIVAACCSLIRHSFFSLLCALGFCVGPIHGGAWRGVAHSAVVHVVCSLCFHRIESSSPSRSFQRWPCSQLMHS